MKWIIFWVVWPIFLEPPLFVLRKWRLEGGFIHSPKQPADRAQELWPIFARNTLTGAHRFLAAEVKGCGCSGWFWVLGLRANLVIFGEWLLYVLIANNSLMRWHTWRYHRRGVFFFSDGTFRNLPDRLTVGVACNGAGSIPHGGVAPVLDDGLGCAPRLGLSFAMWSKQLQTTIMRMCAICLKMGYTPGIP